MPQFVHDAYQRDDRLISEIHFYQFPNKKSCSVVTRYSLGFATLMEATSPQSSQKRKINGDPAE